MSAPCTAIARNGQQPVQVEPPPARSPISEERFCDWVASALPGHRMEYFHGLLGHDRMPSAKALQEHDRLALVAVARRAMQLAEDGYLQLVQRRHGENSYSYIAIKTRHRRAGGRGKIGARGGLMCRR